MSKRALNLPEGKYIFRIAKNPRVNKPQHTVDGRTYKAGQWYGPVDAAFAGRLAFVPVNDLNPTSSPKVFEVITQEAAALLKQSAKRRRAVEDGDEPTRPPRTKVDEEQRKKAEQAIEREEAEARELAEAEKAAEAELAARKARLQKAKKAQAARKAKRDAERAELEAMEQELAEMEAKEAADKAKESVPQAAKPAKSNPGTKQGKAPKTDG